jgi:hippurate hydrolase
MLAGPSVKWLNKGKWLAYHVAGRSCAPRIGRCEQTRYILPLRFLERTERIRAVWGLVAADGRFSSRSKSMMPDQFLKENLATYKEWRRQLHQCPELAFQEFKTADFICERLTELSIPFARGIAGTGIVATLEGQGDGPAVGLRADIDALPIHEETNLPYHSQHAGKSHACGHDGHTTMLLAAADYLSKSRNFRGRVRFIFQPAEEAEGGAPRMIEEGLFHDWPVDAVFGLHNWPGLPLGRVAVKAGAVMASMDLFTVIIRGKSVHAAMPHLGTDVIVAAGTLISACQSIVSRSIDAREATVFSFTQIHAGQALNVLPGEARILGTIRALSDDSAEAARARLKDVCEGIARAHGVTIEVAINPRYPVTHNDAACARFSAMVADKLWGPENTSRSYKASMTSEDFAFMLREVPGSYAWMGSGTDVPLHNPSFDFNDELIPLGARYWIAVAESWHQRS